MGQAQQLSDREMQERRAANLIWNTAEDYSVKPAYEAFQEDGQPDLYFNSIIGAVCKYYDFKQFQRLFYYFQQKPEGPLYEDLFWVGLESCVYSRAAAERPGLAQLRTAYARSFLSRRESRPGQELAGVIKTAHLRRVLGEPVTGLGPVERRLLDAVEFPPDLTTEEVVERMERVLDRFFFNRGFREVDDMQGNRVNLRNWLHLPQRLRETTSAVRQLSAGESGPGGVAGGRKLLSPLWFSRPDHAALRAYVTSCFGPSMFRLQDTAAIEKELCTGNHAGCHLHFTRGDFGETASAGEGDRRVRAIAAAQRAENSAYFKSRAIQNRTAIARLTERIQNAIALKMEPTEVYARSGRLQPERIWRGTILGDDRVFRKTFPGELGDLTVDILLDGSASQRGQQARVANQGYLIAESLTRCRIPVRVCAFCSVSGCTVMQVLRDYGEKERNKNILNYTAMGWNRDGLALRAAGYLMEKERSDKKVLLILTDANPNDDQKLPRQGFLRAGKDYGGEQGVLDVSREVRALRKKGVRVLCVFTGGEDALPAARQIYGRDLARIRSVNFFADTVGRLIQERIRDM